MLRMRVRVRGMVRISKVDMCTLASGASIYPFACYCDVSKWVGATIETFKTDN